MIANKQWFTRRKYTGWGLTPKTWQGWVYILVAILLVFIFTELPLSQTGKLIGIVLLTIFFVVDVLQAMAEIKLDEREAKIEAIAERNASWSMVAAIAVEVMYVSINQLTFISQQVIQLLIIVLFTGVIVKGLTNYILKSREL